MSATSWHVFLISFLYFQVYKGLDICSAKVTAEEQAQVKHHLLSVAESTDNYDVLKFRDHALSIVSSTVLFKFM